jgi:hypothetical protein
MAKNRLLKNPFWTRFRQAFREAFEEFLICDSRANRLGDPDEVMKMFDEKDRLPDQPQIDGLVCRVGQNFRLTHVEIEYLVDRWLRDKGFV